LSSSPSPLSSSSSSPWRSAEPRFTTDDDERDNAEAIFAKLVEQDLSFTLREFVRGSSSPSSHAADITHQIHHVASGIVQPDVWKAVIDHASPADVQAYFALCVRATAVLEETPASEGSSRTLSKASKMSARMLDGVLSRAVQRNDPDVIRMAFAAAEPPKETPSQGDEKGAAGNGPLFALLTTAIERNSADAVEALLDCYERAGRVDDIRVALGSTASVLNGNHGLLMLATRRVAGTVDPPVLSLNGEILSSRRDGEVSHHPCLASLICPACCPIASSLTCVIGLPCLLLNGVISDLRHWFALPVAQWRHL
jgi:hypothetical protein